mmetsp:Transcript_8772/g.15170  ORF Transcript_8772/g.15170 Transcript_8772/m.15170 type:complete len:215 (-) Transcript_8772:984-1628(-)
MSFSMSLWAPSCTGLDRTGHCSHPSGHCHGTRIRNGTQNLRGNIGGSACIRSHFLGGLCPCRRCRRCCLCCLNPVQALCGRLFQSCHRRQQGIQHGARSGPGAPVLGDRRRARPQRPGPGGRSCASRTPWKRLPEGCCSCCEGHIIQGTTCASHCLTHTACQGGHRARHVIQGVRGAQLSQDGVGTVRHGVPAVPIAHLGIQGVQSFLVTYQGV